MKNLRNVIHLYYTNLFGGCHCGMNDKNGQKYEFVRNNLGILVVRTTVNYRPFIVDVADSIVTGIRNDWRK